MKISIRKNMMVSFHDALWDVWASDKDGQAGDTDHQMIQKE